MRWCACAGWIVLAGCYPGPELPLVDEVPIRAVTSCAASREERVSCVLDGDTFDVTACGEDLGERIRLLGINAPEIAHEDSVAECYGPEAEDEMRRLVDGRRVTLSFDEQCTDTYGRTLAYVWIAWSELNGEVSPNEVSNPGTSLLVNEWMLQEGYARVFDEDFGHPLRLVDRLAAAEAEAQSRNLGLWSACDTTGG